MRIECGEYILYTDSYKNMWITKQYHGKTRAGKVKEENSEKRVTGYQGNISSLSKDFLERGLYGFDADNMKDLIKELSKLQLDIDKIYKKYKEENKNLKGEN